MPQKDIDVIHEVGIISERFKKGILKKDTRMETIAQGFGNTKFNLDPEEKESLENLGDFKRYEDFVKELNKIKSKR
jgi:hypothetical protein